MLHISIFVWFLPLGSLGMEKWSILIIERDYNKHLSCWWPSQPFLWPLSKIFVLYYFKVEDRFFQVYFSLKQVVGNTFGSQFRKQ